MQFYPSLIDTTLYRLFYSEKLSVDMGQHCKSKDLVQCCSRGSRQHCTGKNPVQCYLNTLGTALRK